MVCIERLHKEHTDLTASSKLFQFAGFCGKAVACRFARVYEQCKQAYDEREASAKRAAAPAEPSEHSCDVSDDFNSFKRALGAKEVTVYP